MAENNVKYDAFISYRHSELDKFVATTLHKKLEAFKLPKGVKSPTGKTKIERVFITSATTSIVLAFSSKHAFLQNSFITS